ncbi:unnamed protein product [Brugia timori]|uniref:Translocon-associated protein subunit beta n=1 Tax=Brugia timori TaxID=42155 RepID=A0A0R3QY56_9BILA|nr:unnamed protein product [Brugia timori]
MKARRSGYVEADIVWSFSLWSRLTVAAINDPIIDHSLVEILICAVLLSDLKLHRVYSRNNFRTLRMRWKLSAFLMLYVSITYGEDTDMNDSAHIVASKFTLSQYAVEGMDYIIDYRLYNVGDKAALRVALDDRDGFPTQTFDVIQGLLQVRWERIAPGNNVSHSVVVRPRAVGAFNYSSAQITYYPTEDAKEVRVSYTTAPGEGYIYRRKDYDRKFSAKVGVWLVFLMLVAPSTVIPFILWYSSKSKYDQEAPLKKSK